MRRRILIVTRSTPFHRLGGMEVVLWDLGVEFARLGQDVTVMTTLLERPVDTGGVKMLCLPCAKGRYSIKWWLLSRRFFRQNLSDSVDVVLSISAGAFALSRHNTKAVFVAQLHGTAWGEFVSKIRQRKLVPLLTSVRNLGWLVRDFRYRMFDVLTFVGPAVYEEAARVPMSGVLGNRVKRQIITNGVSEKQFAFDQERRSELRAKYGFKATDRVVVWSSRLHYQKGVLEGLQAFHLAAMDNQNMQMLIAGDGPEAQAIERFIRDNQLSQRVRLTGRVPRDDLPALLSAADLFLFTTKRVEGLPMNVLEALANGLPAIISASIDNPDFGAISVDPNDARSVADALLEARLSDDRRSRLAEQYTLSYSANAYLSLFSKIESGAN